MLSIKFLGAAQTVTGSSFLVEGDGIKFLVDCGMFQGKEVEDRNALNFDFDPKEVDFLVLTHAHIDHIGMVPKLIKHGFQGEIYLTAESANLAYYLLLDAAKIQEMGSSGNWEEGKKVAEIYNTTHALEAISRFSSCDYDKEIHAAKGTTLRFERVGHVLGAASVFIKVGGKTLAFSGDIGRKNHPFLIGFDDETKQVDYVVMEALYGGKFHEDRQLTEKQFIDDINKTVERNGNVIIPAFSLQRTQELLYILKKAYSENLIKRKVDVYLDSPLAIKVTDEYSRAFFKGNRRGRDMFSFDELRIVMNARRSLGKGKGPKIIIAGSGMADGGRIVNHLKRNLPDAKTSVMIVGFQAEGTLGRKLVDGAENVLISKKTVAVNAEIHKYFGFSAHGDDKDLNMWLARCDEDQLKRVFLVHGEAKTMEVFKEENSSKQVYIPEWKEKIMLD